MADRLEAEIQTLVYGARFRCRLVARGLWLLEREENRTVLVLPVALAMYFAREVALMMVFRSRSGIGTNACCWEFLAQHVIACLPDCSPQP
jgi:hypothetical protein